MGLLFLPITNYPQFIQNQYQEVGQKPAHTALPQKTLCFNIWFILAETLWQKEKVLITSNNFSFSHDVIIADLLQETIVYAYGN